MTESHQAVLSRLSHEFDALARQMSRVSGELTQLDRLFANTEATRANARSAASARSAAGTRAAPGARVRTTTGRRAPAGVASAGGSVVLAELLAVLAARIGFAARTPTSAPMPAETCCAPPAQRSDTGSDHAESGWIGKLLAVAGWP